MRVLLVLLVFFSSVLSFASTARVCNVSDLQACKSCAVLETVLVDASPNAGEYYHAAQWNGLYAAYIQNCISVAEKLLNRGADPNLGGSSGSMVISVSKKWPHYNKNVNREWALLLLKYGASASNAVLAENKTPDEIQSDYNFIPDYPDVWALFHM